MDTSSTATHSENFEALLQAGLPQKVAEKLDEIYIAGERTLSSHTQEALALLFYQSLKPRTVKGACQRSDASEAFRQFTEFLQVSDHKLRPLR